MNQFRSTKWDHTIGYQILLIRDFLRDRDEETHHFDFSHFNFCPPMLSLFVSKLVKDNSFIFSPNPLKSSYHETICLLEGLDPDTTKDWKIHLEGYQQKTFLPLIRFGTKKDSESAQIRNNLISQVGQMIKSITGINANFFSGVSYLLSELSDNIVDHSLHSHGWISFQYYPSDRFIDICLGDSGYGVLASYQRYSGPKDYSYIHSDKIAIGEMIKGESTKKEDERGFGFHTSREMLIDGMGGNFSFISGEALLLNYKLLNFGTKFPGTLAHLRIPLRSLKSGFSIYDYVE
ncbi:ATP-binding protein [Rhodonellum sp.]|uniref:ATP-binding protein n=1 Tax=Rhodonellum sp. TaxID=2231180 RepID=UPI0027214B1D|nr:ATP-binding protein [Rhodonellum sp.]MDO9553116.1 ATP-binding protein [Rhodonellum sp.]